MEWAVLIPVIYQLMVMAETEFKDEPNAGEKKKALVEGLLPIVAESMAMFSTGGQKKTWTNISKALVPGKALIGKTIDLLAMLRFPVHG